MLNRNLLDLDFVSSINQMDWNRLKRLSLGTNKIGKLGSKLLAKGKWPNLEELDLGFNFIENDGAFYICQAHWPKLRKIILSNLIYSQVAIG